MCIYLNNGLTKKLSALESVVIASKRKNIALCFLNAFLFSFSRSSSVAFVYALLKNTSLPEKARILNIDETIVANRSPTTINFNIVLGIAVTPILFLYKYSVTY